MEFVINDTWISVVNAALELLNKPHLSQLSDSGETAASVRLYLPNAVETVASRYRWSCLSTVADLNRMGNDDIDGMHLFRLPTDIAYIEEVHTCNYRWERRGSCIASMADNCRISYVRMPTTPQDLDPLLKGAVENLLASLCAIKLTGSSEMQNTYLAIYENDIQLQIQKEKELAQPYKGNLYWHEEGHLG